MDLYLHSIMYLLIPRDIVITDQLQTPFTFHNVSINSEQNQQLFAAQLDLHSIMYLLIPVPALASMYET